MVKRKLWKERPIDESTTQQTLEDHIIDFNKFMKETANRIKKMRNENKRNSK